MNVSTLRVTKILPGNFQESCDAGKGFRVEIDGKQFPCRSLTDAQKATAGYPDTAAVQLINAPA